PSPPPPSPTCADPHADPLANPPCSSCRPNYSMNVNNVCEDNSCFSATTRVRVKVPSAGMPSGPAPPVWQDTALEDLRIGKPQYGVSHAAVGSCPGPAALVALLPGDPSQLAAACASLHPAWLCVAGSEVECVVPVGTAGMDLSGAITNTAYQLDTCYVYSYVSGKEPAVCSGLGDLECSCRVRVPSWLQSLGPGPPLSLQSHAVRATITHTRLTFTRADGSIGQLSATPTHPYFLPGHSVPLTPALPASPAAAGNVTWATGHAESSCAADTEPPSNLVNVPGGWKPFADVAVGDLMMLSDASSGRLHTTTITAVETVLGYGSFSPLLQGNALIVVEGVAVYTMVLAAHYAVVGPYEVAFSQRLAAQGTSQAVDAAPYSVPGHDVLQATPVVRATIRLPANQQQQEEAQLPHLAAQTCPGQLPELTHTPAAFPSQSSLVEASTGGAMQLNMGLHQQFNKLPLSTPTAAATEQPQPSCSMPGIMQQPSSMQLLAPAQDLLPLWRHCLDHWAISPSLSQSWQRSSPPLASQLALASTGQLALVLEPTAPDAYLDMASVPTSLQPAVRKLLGGCVQLGSRLSDLPFVSSLVDMFIALLEQGGMAGLAALADQQQAGMQFASILDVVGAFA
ncbi:hypothetical protein QJQ45_029930, partial [Haematococcus lacustris]